MTPIDSRVLPPPETTCAAAAVRKNTSKIIDFQWYGRYDSHGLRYALEVHPLAVEAETSDDFLWVPIGELARRAGIAQPVMSRRIARLVQDGLLETRAGRQGAKLVNIAAYDRVRARTSDGIKSLAAASARTMPSVHIPPLDASQLAFGEAPAKADPNEKILSQEQARRVSYQAELARLDLEERLGKLVPINGVVSAAQICGDTIIRALDVYVQRAEEIAAAVAKDGVAGARGVAKQHTIEVRRAIAAAMNAIAAAPPVTETAPGALP